MRRKYDSGTTSTPEYKIFKAMGQRCHNPNANGYRNYGGRGIRVCQRFRVDFLFFRQKLGLRPTSKHTLDRVNNDGHYSCGHCDECLANRWPFNLRWATHGEQRRNSRQVNVITIDGVSRCLTDWLKVSPIGRFTVEKRIYKNGVGTKGRAFYSGKRRQV